MPPQVSKEMFVQALTELGHDTQSYQNQRLSLQMVSEVYGMDHDVLVDAITHKWIDAQFDLEEGIIMISSLDAAHLFYCIQSEAHLYSTKLK